MADSESRSKVVRLIEKYDLDGIGDELAERWTRSDDRMGLRPLAEFFNRELLRAVLADGSTDPLEGEIENTYRLLTDDDVSSGVRTQTRSRLEQEGVDVEQLSRDFVSRQAIHTYLTEYRDLEQPAESRTPPEQRERKRETIERLTNRLVAVTERALGDLRNTGYLTLGEYTVIVTVRVNCLECGTHRSVVDLLSDGGCDCQT